MPISVQALFDHPQREIASILRDRPNRCISASLVAGFMTVEGAETISDPLRANPGKLDCLVVGAALISRTRRLMISSPRVSFGEDCTFILAAAGRPQVQGKASVPALPDVAQQDLPAGHAGRQGRSLCRFA